MDRTTRRTIRLSLVMVTAFTAGLTIAEADVVQSIVDLPPPAGAYAFPSLCISTPARCVENAAVSDFHTTSDTQSGGNELVVVDALYSADIYLNNGGKPGMLLGPVSFMGTMDFTYDGRDPSSNPLGVFPTQLTSFNFTGHFNGNSFVVQQTMEGTGSTSIFELTFSPPIEYTVSGALDVFAEYSINGGTFTTAPQLTATLTAVPEPGYTALGGSLLIGLLAMTSRCRQV